eukprot:196452_1
MNIKNEITYARTLAKSGKRTEAKQRLLKLLDTYPNNLEIIRGIGVISYKLQQYNNALHYFQTYIQINGSNYDICRRIADTYRELNQLDQAEKYYNEALNIEPYDRLSMCGLAKLMEKFQNYNQAQKIYQNVITQYPLRPDLYYSYGILLKDTFHNIKGAIPIFKKAMQLATDQKLNINKYKNVYDECIQLQLSKHQFNINTYKIIKVIVYNFDELILFLSPNMHYKNIYQIFGGNDRINRLKQHFLSLSNQSITLALFTTIHPNMVQNWLQKICLWSFFEGKPDFIFSNHFEEIKTRFSDLSRGNILYIDIMRSNNIYETDEICKILPIKSEGILPGLKVIDIEYIESIFQIILDTRVYDSFDIPNSMITNLYNCIKNEIKGWIP